MSLNNPLSTDYLRFSANSMLDLMKQYLNSNGKFTDQLFEGSNLSILLGSFSQLYTVLMFYLNNSSSESIFTDSQLFENINRIVKMLGYNPIGFITATFSTSMTLMENQSFYSTGIKTIPKYTTINTGLYDSKGFPIKYTFVEDFTFTASSVNVIESDSKPLLYNGEWILYPSTFSSTGIPFETFTMNDLTLDGVNRIYLSHNNVYVYVQNPDNTFDEYTPTTNLYNHLSNEKKFEIRLNEDYKYTLKFGDNINGVQLKSGSVLYVVYLKSNGSDGQIGANVLTGTTPMSVSITGLTELFIKQNILKVNTNTQYINFGSGSIGYTIQQNPELQMISLYNNSASTFVSDIENADSIRTNAPNWFRMGGRLITVNDFEQYILTNYSTSIYDISVMNNWDYMAQFQSWLYKYNKLTTDIRYLDYNFSDTCDFNNIYLWVKSYSTDNTTVNPISNSEFVSTSIKRLIERDCNRLKPVTAELVFLDPFMTAFTPQLGGTYSIDSWDTHYENKIQLVKERNTLMTTEKIRQNAISIIKEFFNLSNCKLGMKVDINDLYNQLTAISGVQLVRTKYLPYNTTTSTYYPESSAQYYNGLMFATWTKFIVNGADIQKFSGGYQLENFQFPYLYNSSTIGNLIEVYSDTFSAEEVEY